MPSSRQFASTNPVRAIFLCPIAVPPCDDLHQRFTLQEKICFRVIHAMLLRVGMTWRVCMKLRRCLTNLTFHLDCFYDTPRQQQQV